MYFKQNFTRRLSYLTTLVLEKILYSDKIINKFNNISYIKKRKHKNNIIIIKKKKVNKKFKKELIKIKKFNL